MVKGVEVVADTVKICGGVVLVKLHVRLRRENVFARAWGVLLLKKEDAEGVRMDASRHFCICDVLHRMMARGVIICLLPGCHRKPMAFTESP